MRVRVLRFDLRGRTRTWEGVEERVEQVKVWEMTAEGMSRIEEVPLKIWGR